MFIAVLFVIAQSWNNPTCLSMVEWLHIVWSIYITFMKCQSFRWETDYWLPGLWVARGADVDIKL